MNDEEIDAQIYEPQSHIFLWDGHVRVPYLIQEQAKAEADAKHYLAAGWPTIELWRSENGEDKFIRRFSYFR